MNLRTATQPRMDTNEHELQLIGKRSISSVHKTDFAPAVRGMSPSPSPRPSPSGRGRTVGPSRAERVSFVQRTATETAQRGADASLSLRERAGVRGEDRANLDL